MRRSNQPPLEIVRLAQDLGLGAQSNPYTHVVDFCVAKVLQLAAEHGGCETLTDLLELVVNKVNSRFEEIHDDVRLDAIQKEYCARGEIPFADLHNELAGEVYGVTYRLMNPDPWEPQYVSIIDCRGDKSFRSYFTKWHEVAHLLTLSDQGRLVFRRTHSSLTREDPEEGLMDSIAGRIGFASEFFHSHIGDEISFAEIERLRNQLCPEASAQASLINFVRLWPSPVIHLELGLGLNSQERLSLKQGSFDFMDQPQPVLRALRASPNDRARISKFQLFDNMRVLNSP